MRYLLCGDVHHNWTDLHEHMQDTLARGIHFDAVIQVGDFGIYPGTTRHLFTLFHDNAIPIHFLDGNHEQHDYLGKVSEKLKRLNIFYHKRGDIVFTSDGVSIGWMGGALNVDQPQPINHGGGWHNIPSPKRIKDFIIQANKLGRPIDLMLTHSCPGGIGIGMKGVPIFEHSIREYIIDAGFTTYPDHDVGDYFLTDLYEGLTHKPVDWVFGHYHKHWFKVVGTTRFRCVGTTDTNGGRYDARVYLYDTNHKTVLT